MVNKTTLSNWLLKRLNQGSSAGSINGDTLTGIIAYVEGDYFHFKYQENLKEKIHIKVLDSTLADCFNYQSVGTLAKKEDPTKEPTYNQDKLEEFCEAIMQQLKEKGKFELVLKGNSRIEFIQTDD